MTTSRQAVSAPGKALLAGGYLVLDREYTGLVFGLDARIHVIIQPLPTSSGVALSEIIVKSPQFKGANWEYGYRLAEYGGGIEVTQLRASALTDLHRNPFVETALSYALTYISALASPMIKPASITILADNDYYSQPSSNLPHGAPASDRFNKFGVHLWDAHKTGLGSSAALVTAFIAAVLVHYLPEDVFSLATDSGKARLHNLAQAAHCAAQGKVGSGFDIASAVYGSCIYRRFSPALLESHGEPGSAGFAQHLKALVEETDETSRWDTQITKLAVTVPKGLRLVMCDVDCGSKTPGMVKKVLAWRKEKPEEANRVWTQLQRNNEALATELIELARKESKDYSRLKRCISDIRASIREMSRLSAVPIEPQPQTRLIDACTELPGVIGGVVPGAGGYDAVALLVEDDEQVLAKLRKFLEGWKFEEEDEAEPKPGKVSMLGVREETAGVRVEDVSIYERWIE